MDFLWQNYFTRGFWGDESWTALISSLPLPEIIRVTGEDFHPPFYYFLIHFWGGLFGFGEATLRTVSLFFFLLTPVVVYFLTRAFFKHSTSNFTTSVLIFLSPILATYAAEARSYALLAFLTSFSAFAFWRAREETGYRWRIVYFLIGGISVYTHYYAWFILASHGFFLLLFERHRIKKLLLPALGILFIQLPWLPTLFSQIGEVNRDYWIAPINQRTHWEFYLRVLGGDYTTVFQLPVTLFLTFFILINLLKLKSSRGKTSFSPAIKFLLCWLIIPTLIPSLISLKMPVFFYRYLIFSAIPLLILACRGLFKLPKPVALLGLIFIIALYVAIDAQSLMRFPTSFREEQKLVYQTKVPGDGPIYTVLPAFAEVTYYFQDKEQIIVTPEGLVQFSGKSLLDSFVRAGRVAIELPPEHSTYWFLEPGPKSSLISSQTDTLSD